MLACTAPVKNSNYVTSYQSALGIDSGTAASSVDTDKLANLYRLFRDLKIENIELHVAETYAKEFYFNDTLHTFTDRDGLARYLSDGAERVDAIMVEFEDIAVSGDNYYVRWVMDMKFKVMGKSIESHSIGISQIRFDNNGMINFHQDFWDNTNGLFGHLPVIGSMIHRIRNSMK